ncbi:MAG: SpvB/TcaC N-terminal domain-containing protein [Pseudomonas sp.]|uniref:SpvB/TcaC N-terminal domain-containing protein n=1 Tax=Pseudomonas sp. TaxID=306 RepID=UPI0030F00795
MTLNTATDDLALTPPALPKSGGSLQGMPTAPGPVAADGQASLMIPLPISAGRGYAPSLALRYQSGAGNGPWGSGWQCSPLAIRRSTRFGVPRYTDSDSFLGPDGEVLVAESDAAGQVITTHIASFNGQALDRTYQVTRYLPRIEGSFARIERWQAEGAADFWLIHSPGGELLCLGKSAQARIAEPTEPQVRIAAWLVEESVSPSGEHIYYRYVSAAEVGVSDPDGRDTQSQRSLSTVSYGNVSAQAALWLWSGDTAPAAQAWLFTLVLDYGARGTDSQVPPAFSPPPASPWPVRQDAFSSYENGFEVRSHFLCRQVLMFHHFPAELGEAATLVQRLLLSYDENPQLARLLAAQSLAYEPDATHTLQCLPPLELAYNPFAPVLQANAWQPLPLPAQLGPKPYRLVDVYGEGIPGLLYEERGAWYYRPAVRDPTQTSPDAVTYGELAELPLLPSLPAGRQLRLLDFNGDGRLEWWVTQANGLVGYYTLQADRSWSAFTPLAAAPLELRHPSATLVDLHGAGLPDLALIGTHSVRVYVNQRSGFGPGQNVVHDDDTGLPVMGRDRQELVAFADMLGSGQPQLVSVRHDRLLCWPSLGDGRFAKPLTFSSTLPFTAAQFDPQRVYLADLDGSGCADLLYAGPSGIQLFFNQAGNRLAPAVTLPYPTGMSYDQLSQLQVADLAGQGTATLVLTQVASDSNLQRRHWRFDLSSAKPYLLSHVSNNCGACTTLTHRSSVQEWLDEKLATPSAIAGLPYPVLVLSQLEQYDSVTGNSLVQRFQYRRGYWDPVEREFRGFAYVESEEYQTQAGAKQANALRICRWLHTGRADDVNDLYGEPFHDPDAFAPQQTRLTRWQGGADDGQDIAFSPDAGTAWWLYRALKGALLREEHYGLDAATIPYRVQQMRSQVRLVQPGAVPVTLALSAGSSTYNYERVSGDPQVSQTIPLHYDGYGHTLQTVDIAYPRRLNAQSENPYTAIALPSEAWSATFDAQQTVLRLTESRIQVFNQADPQAWVLGVPVANRQNALTFTAQQIPAGGLTLELLSDPAGLLGASQPRLLLNQQQHHYRSDPQLPKTLFLPDHRETALLLADDLKAYLDVLSQAACEQLLADGGYQRMPALLAVPGAAPEADLWAANTGYLTYLGAAQFWRAHTQTASPLKAADGQLTVTTVAWDSHLCGIVSSTDVYANQVQASINYRFLRPWQITDINGNRHEVQWDALGRLVATSQYGTELGADMHTAVNVGFAPLSTAPAAVHDTVNQAVASALAINAGSGKQQQATRMAYDLFSQMGSLSISQLRPIVADDAAALALYQHLQSLRFITPQGHVLSRAWSWLQTSASLADVPAALRAVLAALPRQPVHSVTLLADNYPNQAQQIRVQLTHSDGFGRALQNAELRPAAQACQRTASGGLAIENGQPQLATAEPCWAISSRIDYTPRGQPAKTYQAFLADDWQFISAAALATAGYADRYFYDAIGRETEVITALGWLRRSGYTPWFTVREDENDTAAERLSACPLTENADG